jgi:hypothetical protein
MHDVFQVQEEQMEEEKFHVSLSNEAKERLKEKLKSQQ